MRILTTGDMIGVAICHVVTAIIAYMLMAYHAFGTNESSYKFGYEQAFSDYKDASTHTGDYSDVPHNYTDVYTCRTNHWNNYSPPGLTNSTACRDGYLAGWKTWCKSDGLDCAYWASTIAFN